MRKQFLSGEGLNGHVRKDNGRFERIHEGHG